MPRKWSPEAKAAHAERLRQRWADAKAAGHTGRLSNKPAHRPPSWTEEQKRLLLQLCADGGLTPAKARKIKKPLWQCMQMLETLRQYHALGEPEVVVENGVRFTRFPPAWARGVTPGKSVGTKSRN